MIPSQYCLNCDNCDTHEWQNENGSFDAEYICHFFEKKFDTLNRDEPHFNWLDVRCCVGHTKYPHDEGNGFNPPSCPDGCFD